MVGGSSLLQSSQTIHPTREVEKYECAWRTQPTSGCTKAQRDRSICDDQLVTQLWGLRHGVIDPWLGDALCSPHPFNVLQPLADDRA
jgi:hypothetical protein